MERIKAAAVLFTNPKRLYIGQSHFSALEKAGSDAEDWCWDRYYNDVLDGRAVEGFVTTEGRFVDRREAVKVGVAADQVLCMTDRGLLSEYCQMAR